MAKKIFNPVLRLANNLLFIGGLWALSGNSVIAQSNILPDQSLGAESSRIIPNEGGLPREEIRGGVQRGTNLFHSFRDFNIKAGRGAYFASPVGVENILGRVTGRNLSDINGTLGVLGNANLFLVNPNGIIFGPNASLDLSGSFLASTAERITFPDGRDFSAQESQKPASLSINVPRGLQWGNQSAPVTVQGSSLLVNQGQSLTLVGGDIRIENSQIEAGSRVDLVGVVADGRIEFDRQDGFVVSEDLVKGNVTLTNSTVTVVSTIGGDISINAKNVDIFERSSLLAGSEGSIDAQSGDISINATDKVVMNQGSIISNNSLGEGNTGRIEIEAGSLLIQNGASLEASAFDEGDAGLVKISAKDSVLLEGESSQGFLSAIASQVQPGAKGNAGGVEIKTQSLILKDGTFLAVDTFGEGDAGTIKIIARDSVLLEGQDSLGLGSLVSSQANSQSKGNAGGVEIETGSLFLKDGAFLSASTSDRGDAGTVKINASDSVLLEGESSQGTPANAVSQVNSQAKGNAGGVEIKTRSLILKDGAFLSTSTFGEGNAGTVKIIARDSVSLEGKDSQGLASLISSQVDSQSKGDAGGVEIETGSLILKDGAILSANTLNVGDAGNILVKATTLSLRDGSQIRSNTEQTGAAGNIIVQVQDAITLSGKNTGILANTTASSTGNGGNILIDPVSVTINDGAQIAVNSEGTGQGGDIKLISGSLSLDQGTISAETASNLGGNIDLDIGNQLLLRNNSLITATAGTSQTDGDGGNIDIDTALLVAFPQENSDITANAFEGIGGNIQISTQGIFGTEFRDQLTPASDITASSNFGTDGTVQLDTSLDPTSGLVDLPVQPPQPQQVAQTCTPSGSIAQSEFVYTGRGGLPPMSQQVLNQRNIDVGWVGLDAKNDNEPQHPSVANPQVSPPAESERPQTPQLVEAQGWTTTKDGKVRLTASTTTVPHHLAQRVCPGA